MLEREVPLNHVHSPLISKLAAGVPQGSDFTTSLTSAKVGAKCSCEIIQPAPGGQIAQALPPFPLDKWPPELLKRDSLPSQGKREFFSGLPPAGLPTQCRWNSMTP